MTEHVTEVVEEGFKQRVYDATLRFLGNVLHTMQLEDVTRDELKLLAFMHGVEAIPPDLIMFKGTKRVVSHVDDHGEKHYVENQDGEYRRLARKYDAIINPGRGRKLVESCFNVSLVDFGSIMEEVDPISAMDRAAASSEAKAAAAEAKKAIAEGGEKRPLDVPPPTSETPRVPTIGSRLADAMAPPG